MNLLIREFIEIGDIGKDINVVGFNCVDCYIYGFENMGMGNNYKFVRIELDGIVLYVKNDGIMSI